jgi:hypothetical protein
VVAPATAGGTPQPAQVAPVGEAFALRPGDQIVYPAAVPFTFANQGQEPARMLTAVVLPAGSGSPPSSSWVEGTPAAEAMAGVSSEILGDAVAPGWPRPPLRLVVDRLALGRAKRSRRGRCRCCLRSRRGSSDSNWSMGSSRCREGVAARCRTPPRVLPMGWSEATRSFSLGG